MSFPEKVADEALTLCDRSCCICHKFCGTKIELHHIRQKAYGGEDTLDNCIPLCLDCHADMGKANPKHPKGRRYSEAELKRHRDNWYKKVEALSIYAHEKVVYKEDIKLFQTICDVFTPDIKQWLSEQDIGGVHPYEVFDPLAKYSYTSDDPFSEFINPELEKLRGNLVNAIDKFLSYKALNTFVRNVGEKDMCVTRKWMVSHEDWSYDPITYEKESTILNDLATSVWDTYCEFVRQGRRYLAQ